MVAVVAVPSPEQRQPWSRSLVAGCTVTALVAATVLLAACGGDESAGSTTTTGPAVSTTTGPAGASTTVPAGAPTDAFCSRAETFNRTLGTVDAGSVESFDVIAEQVAGLSAASPPELAGDLATMSEYWNRLAAVDTNDPTQVGKLTERDNAVVAAGQRVTAYLVDECGLTPVE